MDLTLLDYVEDMEDPDTLNPRGSTPIRDINPGELSLEMSIIDPPSSPASPWVFAAPDGEKEESMEVQEWVVIDEWVEDESEVLGEQGEEGIQEEWVIVDQWVEDEACPMNTGQKTASRGYSTCQLCHARTACRLRHLKGHLPPYTLPNHYCWQCERRLPQVGEKRLQQHEEKYGCDGTGRYTTDRLATWVEFMSGMFLKLCYILSVPGIPALYEFVKRRIDLQPDPIRTTLEPQDILWFQAFEERNGFPMRGSREYTLDPINSIGMITHWRVVANLLGLLSKDDRDVVRGSKGRADHRGLPLDLSDNDPRLRHPHSAIDCHFHQDKILKQLDTNDWDDVHHQLTTDPDVELVTAITCYAFPESWPKPGSTTLDDLSFHHSPTIKWTVGWHPTRGDVNPQSKLVRFTELLRSPGCRAAGELGLDYCRATSVKERQLQRELLRKLLSPVLSSHLPVIIHCRDTTHPIGSNATQDCIAIMERELPRLWPVYVHCFNGGLRESQQWIQAFPFVRFGISPIVLTKARHQELKAVIRNLDHRRILLESDAPYFTRDPTKFRTFVADVGREVAKIQGIPLGLVFYFAEETSTAFFRTVRHQV